MTTVAITGASGVVGGAVLSHLLARGDEVRVLSRSQEFSEEVAARSATPVAGSLFDGGVVRVCEGAELLFHVAGVNELCVDDPAEMERVNVEGTRHALAAAEQAGVRRVVVTSSAVTLGERRGQVANELVEHRGSFHSHYERTKFLQEEAAFSWSGSVEVVCVNPSSVQGPGRATGTGALLLRAIEGRLPALPNVPISIVDIDDCARGHLLAAERGTPGERYVLNGFTVTTKRALELLGRVVGEAPSVRVVPASAIRLAAKALRRVERVKRLPAPLCAEALETIAFGHRYDGRRATLELGLEYTEPEETLRRFVEWARSEGHLS